MKSTNLQFHLKLDNQTKNYLKMHLLNYILISFVTLTQSMFVPGQTQTLSSIIADHPNFRSTLLNKTLVPFINECVPNAKPIPKTLCGSYFEMVKKLDDSKVYNLKSIEGFNEVLNMHKEDRIQEFCKKFSGYLPKDPKQYPQSNQLNKYVNDSDKCNLFCTDDTELDGDKVKQICIVLSSGWEKALTQPSITTTTRVITEEHHSQNQQSDATLKSDATSKLGAAANVSPQSVIMKPEDEPAVVDKNVPVAQTADEANEKVQGTNAELPGNPNDQLNNPNTEKDQSELKPITSNNNANNNQNQVAVPVNPVVKEQIQQQQEEVQQPPSGPSGETKFENENLDVGKEEIDKTNFKTSVTDTDDTIIDNNNDLDETKLENDLKYKSPNLNEEDINEEINGPEDNEDEELDSNVQPKSSQEAGPSKSQIISDQNVDPFRNDTDSNFFTYFMFLLLVCVIAYVVYHNKTKMLALMLEGRRSSANGRSGLSRRKHTAAYRKLDSNLEEAITSSANGRSTQVIY